VPFQVLLDYIEAGQTLDEFLNHFPTVAREAAMAAFEEASHGYTGLTVPEAGFADKTNGELLQLAQNWFALVARLLRDCPHQQNLANLKIAVLAVRAETNQMIDVLPHVPECWLPGIQSSP
jgi:hypothetical protein